MDAKFFTSETEFRNWLVQNHAASSELLVGFHKKESGRGGMTYAQALDEALCFGWIDGVRKSAGPESYTIRFSPRRPDSIWSRVNLRHAERLSNEGRMQAAGKQAFARRRPERSGIYSFEKRPEAFPRALEEQFRAHDAAWAFWQQQPPGYRRTVINWVTSAKQEPTRQRRLAAVIGASDAGRRVDLLSPLRGS